MYESMMNYNIFGRGQLMNHPLYSLMKSAKQDQDGLVDKYKRGRDSEEAVVFFFIPGNMGGFIQLPPISNAILNYTSYLNEQ